MEREITLPSPAKINLYLAVLGRCPDGYHDIETLFQTVSLADTVTVCVDDSGRGVEVTSDDASLPAGEANLAGRAVRALLDEEKIADSAFGIRICIQKRIPVGAGLGGGSGDAATTLVALNRLLNLRLSAERLESIGATVGSDVPFLVRGGAAIGRGRGEILTRVPSLEPVNLLLAKPQVSVSTRWAYENLGQTLTRPGALSIVAARCGNLNVGDLGASLWNAFEDAVTRRHPEVREIRDAMIAGGASGALMSGTGPTVVGIFTEVAKLRDTESSLRSLSCWYERATPVGERDIDAS